MGVQEAVLGAIVARPDHGYRIIKRLEDRWSSAAVYKALRRLRERELIEPTEALTEPGGRLRKLYCATQRGASLDAARLATGIREIPGHREIIGRLEVASEGNLLAIIDEYERQVLAQVGSSSYPGGVIAQLVAREREMVNEVRLRWVSIAREVLSQPGGEA